MQCLKAEADTYIAAPAIKISGLLEVVTGEVERLGRNVLVTHDYDEHPETSNDMYPGTSVQSMWEPTSVPSEVITGTGSAVFRHIDPANRPAPTPPADSLNSNMEYRIPEAYMDSWNDPTKVFRYQLDWKFYPGDLPPLSNSQLFAVPGDGSNQLPIIMSQLGDGTTPIKAMSGTYNGLIHKNVAPLYGISPTINLRGFPPVDQSTAYFSVDNVVLYIVGDGPDTTATNTYIVIPREEKVLAVGQTVIVRNPGLKLDPNDPNEPDPGSIRVVVNQLTRWSQMANPGAYGATV